MDEWDNITVLRRKPAPGSNKTEAAINQARRAGGPIETTKKFGAGSNRQVNASKDTAKLDRETEDFHHQRVGLDAGKAIQQARIEKNWTQKDLAQRVNEKPSVINEYENGSAIVNPTLMSKLERALGVKLRGKNIGEKFSVGKKTTTPSSSSSS